MPESTGSDNYYHRGIRVSSYFVAAFSKSADNILLSHTYKIVFLVLLFFFILLILFIFLILFLHFLLSFISFTRTYRIYVHTYMRIMHETLKFTKEQNINCCLYLPKNRPKSPNFTIFLLKKTLICWLKCQKNAAETSNFAQFSCFFSRYNPNSSYYYLDRYCMNI